MCRINRLCLFLSLSLCPSLCRCLSLYLYGYAWRALLLPPFYLDCLFFWILLLIFESRDFHETTLGLCSVCVVFVDLEDRLPRDFVQSEIDCGVAIECRKKQERKESGNPIPRKNSCKYYGPLSPSER